MDNQNKRQDLLSEINVRVIKLSDKELIREVVNSKQDRNFRRDKPDDIESVDTKTLQRWEVNYIRHNLTTYDYLCAGLFGKIVSLDDKKALKRVVLDKIAETYPYLAKECKRQKIS